MLQHCSLYTVVYWMMLFAKKVGIFLRHIVTVISVQFMATCINAFRLHLWP